MGQKIEGVSTNLSSRLRHELYERFLVLCFDLDQDSFSIVKKSETRTYKIFRFGFTFRIRHKHSTDR